MIQADAEVGVVQGFVELQRAFQRLLDALTLARGGQPFATEGLPLRARSVGSTQIEPGFGLVRFFPVPTPVPLS